MTSMIISTWGKFLYVSQKGFGLKSNTVPREVVAIKYELHKLKPF